MDIFEQLESAHIVLMNQVPTINFGWNEDDDDDDWCLSVYGYGESGNWEYYFSRSDLENAEPCGDDAFRINDHTTIEFCMLVPVSDMKSLVENSGGIWEYPDFP